MKNSGVGVGVLCLTRILAAQPFPSPQQPIFQSCGRWIFLDALKNFLTRPAPTFRRFRGRILLTRLQGQIARNYFGGTREPSAHSGRDYQRGLARLICPVPTVFRQDPRARLTIGATISAVTVREG